MYELEPKGSPMSDMEAEVYSGDMRGCDECGVGPEDDCLPDCPWVATAQDAATSGPSPDPIPLIDVLANVTE